MRTIAHDKAIRSFCASLPNMNNINDSVHSFNLVIYSPSPKKITTYNNKPDRFILIDSGTEWQLVSILYSGMANLMTHLIMFTVVQSVIAASSNEPPGI
jgi:hypothetical protein